MLSNEIYMCLYWYHWTGQSGQIKLEYTTYESGKSTTYSRLPGFNSIQIRFYSDNSQPLRFVHFRIRSNPNGWVYAKAGASGNEGSNTIWYVVDLPDSYVVYSSLIWPDWPVQWYQYKHIYISLLSTTIWIRPNTKMYESQRLWIVWVKSDLNWIESWKSTLTYDAWVQWMACPK
jgi:hypothetical protein